MRNSTLRRLPSRRLPLAVAATAAALTLAGCAGSDSEGAEDPSASTAVETSQTPSAEETTSEPPAPPSATATYEDPEEVTDITLASPTDGATVSGSIDVSGTANSVEANVPWYLVDANGVVTKQGAFTAEGWMDKLYPYAGSVDLTGVSPGAYTFVVSTDDPSDGEGKPAQQVEVSITVK